MKQTLAVSPWLAAARAALNDEALSPLFQKEIADFEFSAFNTGDALWIIACWPNGSRLALRTAFAPDDELHLQDVEEGENEVVFSLTTIIGSYEVKLAFPAADQPLLRCTTTLTPSAPLAVPFWPRDLIALGRREEASLPLGEVHLHQVGPRSGLVYGSMKRPRAGSFLYQQNLTALNEYCEQTGATLADTVGGWWPELGFALPPAKDKPLKEGAACVISDAFLLLSPSVPADEFQMARQFLELLAGIYIHFPKPATRYYNWPDIVKKQLHDIQHSAGCWTQVQGHSFLTAYLCDYSTPPEIMVQLAVLLPLKEYAEWSKEGMPLVKEIEQGLPAFYDERVNCIARWLPAAEEKLDGNEEHKKPRIMDSWYLHHPLLNLSRLALSARNKTAEKLFLDSIEYPIKVAHRFKYQWPVFYNMDTLEVVKAEAEPGKGGEKDVPGLYAHVMLQAWKLTGAERYLDEAKKAAKALQGTGFTLFYQANNTAFSAGAMLTLYKITKDQLHLELAYLCLANIFKNVWLWDCNYDTGKHFPSFFALFPLSNAPYVAVYEEQEVFAALHDFLAQAVDIEILPALQLLIPEFMRYMIGRAIYYYPPMLPEEMLSGKAKTGEIVPKLWIPLEDIYDGTMDAGTVGQQVYGAGLACGITPRHYHRVPDGPFMVFIDYPIANFSVSKKNGTVRFNIIGDERMHCRLRLLPLKDEPLPSLSVKRTRQGKRDELTPEQSPDGYLEYQVRAGQQIVISWRPAGTRAEKKPPKGKLKASINR